MSGEKEKARHRPGPVSAAPRGDPAQTARSAPSQIWGSVKARSKRAFAERLSSPRQKSQFHPSAKPTVQIQKQRQAGRPKGQPGERGGNQRGGNGAKTVRRYANRAGRTPQSQVTTTEKPAEFSDVQSDRANALLVGQALRVRRFQTQRLTAKPLGLPGRQFENGQMGLSPELRIPAGNWVDDDVKAPGK